MGTVSEVEKRCPRCREAKLLTDENFYRNTRQGWGGYCKPCVKAKAVEWMKANPEKKKASDFRQGQKPERKRKSLENLKRWAESHPGANAERWHRWNAAHPEAAKLAMAKFKKTEKYRAWMSRFRQRPEYKEAHKIRSRMFRATVDHQVLDGARRTRRWFPGAENHLTLTQWLAILQAFGQACCYCQQAGKRPEMDHVVPLASGGGHVAANILPACRSCNSQKRIQTFEWFCQQVGVDPIATLARRDTALNP